MMPRVDPFLPDDAKLAAIRELLPSTGSGIRLDATVAGPFPAETDRALQEADDWELRVGRGGRRPRRGPRRSAPTRHAR